MVNLFDPVLGQIEKLWARVDRVPVVRWATVTQSSPLRVILDGDTDAMPFTPASVVRDITVGSRVVCVEQNRRVIVVDAPRAGLIARAGSATATAGDQTGITSTVTEITGTSIDLVVTVPATIVFHASATTSSSDLADVVSFTVRDGATSLMERRAGANANTVSSPRHQHLTGEVTLTPGSHRLYVAVRRVAGAGTVTVHKNTLNPAQLIVDRIV
ncbi:MAG: hypothetical protein R2732_05440 [Microbacteriaceae bacterium]